MKRPPDDLDRWPDEPRTEWRLGALRDALEFAYERSPLYRGLWDGLGLRPADVASFDDLRRFPIVEKSHFLGGAKGQAQANPSGSVGFSTRGTSGNPLIIWVDETEDEGYTIPCIRGFVWDGMRAGDRALLLSPSWHRLAAMEGHAAVAIGAVPCYFWGTLADLGHAGYFVDAVCELRPRFISSTPPFLLTVVRHCDATGVDLRELFASVRRVSLVGVAVTPGLRRYLTARLGVEHVFERGGTNEGASLDECTLHNGMHVHEDCCYLEVLDAEDAPCAPGETGRLIVTKLVAGGRPFVRYGTGDRARFIPGQCGCGITFARLRMLGRPESTVVVSGVPVTGFEVRSVLDEREDLVGRVALLVRDATQPDVLRVAIEGYPVADGPEAALARQLGVDRVTVDWLRDAEIAWGFRDVVDVSDLAMGER